MQWGWASDYVGRRPVLLLGPLGLAFTMISFGLSTRFWALLVSRCLQGVFNGNIGKSDCGLSLLFYALSLRRCSSLNSRSIEDYRGGG